MKIFWKASLAVLVALAGVESVFRCFGPPMDALVYQDNADPALRFELKPNSAGMKAGAFTQISSQGLRDREIPAAKPADEFRILALGDHLTFGLGVVIEDDYLRLLESLSPSAQGKKIRTVNLSMYSYNLDQKLALLRQRGGAYDPDFVLFQVYSKDLESLPEPLVRAPGIKNWIRSHSQFLRWRSEKAFWSRKPREGVGPSYPNVILDKMRALQSMMHQEFKVPALVIFCPNLAATVEAAAAQEKMERDFERACNQTGLGFLGLSKEFKGHAPAELLLNPSNPWFGPGAHRIVARAVAKRLKRLIPAKSLPQRTGV